MRRHLLRELVGFVDDAGDIAIEPPDRQREVGRRDRVRVVAVGPPRGGHPCYGGDHERGAEQQPGDGFGLAQPCRCQAVPPAGAGRSAGGVSHRALPGAASAGSPWGGTSPPMP